MIGRRISHISQIRHMLYYSYYFHVAHIHSSRSCGSNSNHVCNDTAFATTKTIRLVVLEGLLRSNRISEPHPDFCSQQSIKNHPEQVIGLNWHFFQQCLTTFVDNVVENRCLSLVAQLPPSDPDTASGQV